MQGGDLVVIAARLGAGKSWTMIKMATEAIKFGKNVENQEEDDCQGSDEYIIFYCKVNQGSNQVAPSDKPENTTPAGNE